MDDFCAHIRRLAEWLNVAPSVPLAFAEPGFRQDLNTPPQPFLELYLVTDGVLLLTVKDQQQELRAGDLALANAHFGNFGRQVAGPFRYGCLSLEIPDEPRFAPWRRGPFLRGRRAPDAVRLQNLYTEISQAYHGPEHPYRDLLLKAAFLQLLAGAGEPEVRKRSTTGSRHNPHVRKAFEIMSEKQADAGLGLSTIARKVGISPSHLVRLFQAHLGRSPMRYLAEMRVRRAQNLLERSNLSIKEIAFLVGFRDQLYFSRVFRRELGTSPRAYRDART